MASSPAERRSRRRPSLVRRLTRLSVAVMGAALLLSSLALAGWVYLSLREAQLKSAEQSAQLLAENVAPALAFHDQQATRDALIAFSRREGLQNLVVREPGGETFAHWPDAAASAPWSDTPVQVRWQGLRLVVPVQLHGERIGSLAWAESFEALNATLLRLAAGAVTVLALSLLGASLLLRWTQRRALAPLIALSRLAERVATSQDYSLRAPVREHDEVGRLAERFNGMLRRIEVWHEDMNQQLAQEQQTGRAMQQLAHRDTLTGLPNRLAFELTLERLFVDLHHPGHVGGQRLALLFIDLDNFKHVNDSLGHAAGDAVLVEVSRRMGSVLRASDTLFRLGGDEFALLVADVAEPDAVEQLAGRLITSVREPLVVQGQVQPVGATVGLAFVPDDATDPESLLCAADAAMYAAKHAGKNTYRRASRAPAAGP
ncbi:diguanylate cyclase (GGDEF)-like protein [Pelomonas saccharophila]|uniref:Diguanylate cyclase (GGDEF)-like protein n=1 Tax=Roseateles saccharophilus TaxID=304 RepID=A0ABU1YJ22_ROSSA|nr:diguanylate cyclase [Roseateles saccharophilus]MDR7268852.1 diguanylate cyclase (GGDEF)-like protein [Roseateles saccharophilus]